MAKKANRQAELARIHIAKKELGMSDDDYRAMLVSITGKSSAGNLTAGQRYQVLDHMKSLQNGNSANGADLKSEISNSKSRECGYKGRPRNMDGATSRDRQLQKIEALLTIGKKPWSYADSLAKRICKVDFIGWVADGDLYKIIAALKKQGEREGWDIKR